MSGIRFQCPNCNSERTANSRMAGRSIRCPDCDATITIPQVIPETLVESAPVVMPSAFMGTTVDTNSPHDARWSDETANTDLAEIVAIEESTADDEPEQVSLGERPPMDEEMDMTPMVDVTFLLLIFFMVTASFASEKVIQQKTSKKEASASAVVQVTDVLTIRIDDLNTFLVMMPDQSEVDASNKQDLVIALDNAKREGLLDDVENVKVEAHESSIHAALVAALDACRNEGLANFQVKVVEDFD